MPNQDKQQHVYNGLAKGFHWVSAFIVLGLLPLGFYMTSLGLSEWKLDLYAWHKSFGTLLLFIVVLRISWKFVVGAPPHLDTHNAWEIRLARFIHILLYAGLIGMPVSGWLMTSYGGFPHAFFGLHIPAITGKDEQMFRIMLGIHRLFAYMIIGAVLLHVAGALKHHVMDKDATLLRILPALWPRIGAGIAVFVLGVSLTLSAVFYVRGAGVQEGMAAAHDYSGEVVLSGVAGRDAAAPETDDVQRWVINRADSMIGFIAKAQSAEFSGRFGTFDGTILFDPQNLAQSKADIMVDVRSVKTGSEDRDGYMMDEAWLNGAHYPVARFISTSFTHSGDNNYVAEGMLTMRGVDVKVKFPFTLVITDTAEKGRMARVEGGFDINRLDYKIGDGDWASESMASHVIKINVAITAMAQ